jgi:ribose 5-phosphate isomerase B
MIYLATDHAGFEHKEFVKDYLINAGHEVSDMGAYEMDALDDYPDFIAQAAAEVSKDPEDSKAIIFGGSGQGEAMMANRFPYVRATVYYGGPEEILTLSREHNDANVLSIGARFVEIKNLKDIVELWLSTGYSYDERHIRRLDKLAKLSPHKDEK